MEQTTPPLGGAYIYTQDCTLVPYKVPAERCTHTNSQGNLRSDRRLGTTQGAVAIHEDKMTALAPECRCCVEDGAAQIRTELDLDTTAEPTARPTAAVPDSRSRNRFFARKEIHTAAETRFTQTHQLNHTLLSWTAGPGYKTG